VHGSTDAIIRN